jgi:DNA replication protein DnaC
MRRNLSASWYLTGPYGSGKTHLLYAQYREMVHAGKIRCQVQTS